MERDARFAGDVSHELRSPLTTLATAASVLNARRDELTPRMRQAADLIVAEIDRFRDLVIALLELNRLQAGADAVRLEPVRIAEMVLHVVVNSSSDDVVVEIDPDLDAEPLMLDKRRVERILANLLNNAREHAGGAVAVTVERKGTLVHFAVEDAGPGISIEDRELVFQRFARGRRSGSRGDTFGSGLGLALVNEHVRLLNGQVWVEDRLPAPGCRFVVEFPARTS
jgi:signal transduction histidine kinase